MVYGRFFDGVGENVVAKRGVFAVDLWCYAWLAWYLNGHILAAEKYVTIC